MFAINKKLLKIKSNPPPMNEYIKVCGFLRFMEKNQIEYNQLKL